jgi:ammonia channel protein AmtB
MAFNVGTLGHLTQPGDGAKMALAVTNTVLSGASGGLAALLFRRLGLFVTRAEEKVVWSFLLTVNGIFVGMVCQ